MALQQLLAVPSRDQLHDHSDPVWRREAAAPAHNVRMWPEMLEQLGLMLQQLTEAAPSGSLPLFLGEFACARPSCGAVGGDVHNSSHTITKPRIAQCIKVVKCNLAVFAVAVTMQLIFAEATFFVLLMCFVA